MISVPLFKKHYTVVAIASCIISILMFCFGVYYGIFDSPPDYQQGEFIRIMYVHVPSAWMALGIYCFMAMCSVSYLIWNNSMADIMARNSAKIGATFAVISIITGSLWGKPIWGAWWVWDARLTSMLILLFFYFGYISLSHSIADDMIRSKAPAILNLVGAINIPIVKFSVNLWTTLHQPASVMRIGGPSIDISMFTPLLLMFLGCVSLFLFLVSLNISKEIMEKKILRIRHAHLKYNQ